MNKHKVLIVEDDDQLRDVLVEQFRLGSDCEARGYGEAEQLLRENFESGLSPEDQPDLVVIDLVLKESKMQGIQLIRELAERNVLAEMVAVSGYEPTGQLMEAIKIGASTAVAKPFGDFKEFVNRMLRLAEIARKRRSYQVGNRQEGMDPQRYVRSVFLSYSSDDERVATGLRRNIEARDIGVWYAPATLKGGDPWRRLVIEGIDQAKVFVALLTDNYLDSPICLGELTRFRRRMESGVNPQPTLLPVLAGLSEVGRKNAQIEPIIGEYHYIDISERFVDRMTALLVRIQSAL